MKPRPTLFCFLLFLVITWVVDKKSVLCDDTDYADVDFNDTANEEPATETRDTNLNSKWGWGSSPSRPSPSRPSPSRPSPSRPSPSWPSPSRPSPSRPATSRPATSRPATSRPATSRPATFRPATSRPSFTTPRPAPPPSTNKPATWLTTRRPPATTYPATVRTTPRAPATQRWTSKPVSFATTRGITFPPATTRRLSPPPTSRPWSPSRTTVRYPSQPPVWSTPRSWTLNPPIYTSGRPSFPVQQGWGQGGQTGVHKPSSGLSGLFGGGGGSPGGSGSSSKLSKIKQLATALYGAYKGKKLQQRVNRNHYNSYSPYYGRNYYYGNRYYPHHNRMSRNRLLCTYYIPANDPTYDMYYEDSSRVQEILYECDANYERCCGNVDCCRGYHAVNGRGIGTGQSVYQEPGYPEEVGYHELPAPAPQGEVTEEDPNMISPTPPIFDTAEANFNMGNMSDDEFESIGDEFYSNSTVPSVDAEYSPDEEQFTQTNDSVTQDSSVRTMTPQSTGLVEGS